MKQRRGGHERALSRNVDKRPAVRGTRWAEASLRCTRADLSNLTALGGRVSPQQLEHVGLVAPSARVRLRVSRPTKPTGRREIKTLRTATADMLREPV